MTSGEDDCVQSPHMKIIPIPHSDIILPVPQMMMSNTTHLQHAEALATHFQTFF